MNIQFCCGSNLLPDFLNTDLNRAGDQHVDITQPLPFPDNTADFLFCEHGFEHITAPEGLRFLDQCFRILKPGGTIRLCVPVLERLGREQARDIILNHGHLAAYQDFDALAQFLEVAGFRDIHPRPRADTDRHWLVIGEAKDDLETCRIEAIKP